MRKFEQTVVEAEDGTWGFTCQGRVYVPDDLEQLVLDESVEPAVCFSSSGWPTREIAEERMAQHAAEHKNTAKVLAARADAEAAMALTSYEDEVILGDEGEIQKVIPGWQKDPEVQKLIRAHNALLMEPQKVFEKRVLAKTK
jgi:hypothetical protein